MEKNRVTVHYYNLGSGNSFMVYMRQHQSLRSKRVAKLCFETRWILGWLKIALEILFGFQR